jgi:hypothetical protein
MHPFMVDRAGAPMRVAIDAAMDAAAPLSLRRWPARHRHVLRHQRGTVPKRRASVHDAENAGSVCRCARLRVSGQLLGRHGAASGALFAVLAICAA